MCRDTGPGIELRELTQSVSGAEQAARSQTLKEEVQKKYETLLPVRVKTL